MTAWRHTWRTYIDRVQEHARGFPCPDCLSPPGHSCEPQQEHPHDTRLRAARQADPMGIPLNITPG